MSELWIEASADHESLAREAALAGAEAEFGEIFPFLAAACSEPEFGHRLALAGDRLEAIAAANGLETGELTALASRRWGLLREALQEGQNPLAWIPDGGGYGSGPEKPDEHDEGPDFSHGYCEVPAGPPGGPDPQVTQVRPPMMAPVQQATGARRQGAGAQLPPPPAPLPSSSAPGPAPANMPAGAGPDQSTTPITPPAIGQVTSSSDPVRRRVMQATAAIRQSNPQLPAAECERVARLVVGRYLTADLDSLATDDDPGTGPGHGGQQDQRGMSGVAEYGLARGLVRAAPEMLAAL